jgi:hypothetical protein
MENKAKDPKLTVYGSVCCDGANRRWGDFVRKCGYSFLQYKVGYCMNILYIIHNIHEALQALWGLISRSIPELCFFFKPMSEQHT